MGKMYRLVWINPSNLLDQKVFRTSESKKRLLDEMDLLIEKNPDYMNQLFVLDLKNNKMEK
jgi:hypothetical protein